MANSATKVEQRRQNAKTRVVVLGGGFAGVYTAKYLTEALGNRTDVHVELLSQENYFVFQPLLPEVAAGGINPNHVVNPIRDIVKAAQFRWCKVQSVDCDNKLVRVAQGEARELVEVPYDHLVFALGKISDFSMMPGVSEHALAMKDLADAFTLRNHVFRCLELADVEADPAEKAALLTFVVAGGGFSGVETIGELSELLHKCIESFRNISPNELKMVLVHGRERLLPEMSQDLGAAAERILQRRGIELVLNTRLRAASKHAVFLSTGRAIQTRTFVCTVGTAANPVVRDIMQRYAFKEGQSGGRGVGVFATDLTLACVDKPGYWSVGDTAGVPDPHCKTNELSLCPPTAQFAIRQAKACAHNILATIDQRPTRNFDFRALGMLASLGSRSAVADMMGIRFSGFLAWFAWRTVYLAKLPGLVRKLRVAIDWTIDLFFPRDITQIQTMRADRLRQQHYEAGEVIIAKSEVGREVFVIRNGEVDVFHGDGDGAASVTLKAGDVFGEKALLMDTPRTSTIKAKTAVDVVVVSREDFLQMVDNFPALDRFFDTLMHDRYPELFGDKSRVAEQVARPVVLPR